MPNQKPAPGELSALLDPILRALLTEIAVDAACVYVSDNSMGEAELRAMYTPRSLFALTRIVLSDWFAGGDEAVVLRAEDLAGTDFVNALLLPLMVNGERLGALGVFSESLHTYSGEEAEQLARWVAPVAALLENQNLREQQHVTKTIQNAVRMINDSSLPQEIANLMHVLSPKVTTCTVTLYGPLREDMPNGPFDYLEVQGSWSRRHGSRIGIGLKTYLEFYPDLLAELNENKILILPDMKAIENRVDSLVRGFLQADRVRSALFLTLGTPQREIGVVMIATDRIKPFTQQEINNYRMVTEFLGVNAMMRVLQQQHDQVQQGRAALLDAVTDGVVMVVPDTGHSPREGHVLTVNQSFTRMFNVGATLAEELALAELLAHMHLSEETSVALADTWLNISVRNPSTQNGEFEMIHIDGYSVNVEWYSAPVYQDKRVMGRIYTFHDVTAERTAERLRSNFISRLSHELRTPLSSIQGYAQLLLENQETVLPERANGHVQTIFDNALHLNRMFTDVILIARTDTGELHLTMETTPLPDVIGNAARMFEARANGRGQTIQLEIEDNLPLARIDLHYFGRILGELLENAIFYGPPDSVIRLQASQITKEKQLPNGAPADMLLPAVLITVADEGAGFPVDEAEAVFVPFYRGRNANAAQIPGTGLGLTIAYSLTTLHRGKIWAEARRRGRSATRFHVMLPVAEG